MQKEGKRRKGERATATAPRTGRTQRSECGTDTLVCRPAESATGRSSSTKIAALEALEATHRDSGRRTLPARFQQGDRQECLSHIRSAGLCTFATQPALPSLPLLLPFPFCLLPASPERRRIQHRVQKQRQRASPEEAVVGVVGEGDDLAAAEGFGDDVGGAFEAVD